ncbi:MAG: hypothetical protein LBU74_03655 [Methanobacteriaceae archaeon]|jgi:hypothetical protein|nr:hypothetical protein [Candidatus Methanorudis spinitermitis]
MENNKKNYKDQKDSQDLANSEMISFNDINYAIYKIGNWKKSYKINLIGTSNEIPATEVTKGHVLFNMDEIRKSTFETEGKEVNGIVGLSMQLNKDLQGIAIDEIIMEEKQEYENIVDEINSLDYEDSNGVIELENDKFLIYKLEKDHHVTKAKPANVLTMKHHEKEIQRLKNMDG